FTMAGIGGHGSLAGRVIGAVWLFGLPAYWPSTDTVPLFTSSIRLLIILLYIPGGFTQIGYWIRDQLFERVEKPLGPAPAKGSVEPPTSLRRDATVGLAPTNTDCTVLMTDGLKVAFGGRVPVDSVAVRA